ncbi:MAG TPA: sensor histidine kinase [Gaiellaceae bacterium]|nr:sensor histidine kinase [Gaiellaceae bacterium]
MSTRERTTRLDEAPSPLPGRAAAAREQVATPPADLVAVWAIGASEGAGAGVDALLTFCGAAVRESDDVIALVGHVAELAGMSEEAACRALFRKAVGRLALSEAAPRDILQTQVRLLVELSPVVAASVWLPSPTGVPTVVAAYGALPTTRGCKRVAAGVLGDDEALLETSSRGRLHGYRLRQGALVVRVPPDEYPDALAFLDEFAAAFATVAERDRLLRANAGVERQVEQVYERRLVRTAFDLHDGPLQEIAALAVDLRLLRSQADNPEALCREVLVGRVDDLTARLTELDESLRAIAASLETSRLGQLPLADALRREATAFERRSGATADVDARGRFEDLTMSQRIAVLRVVQEALNNAREHGSASHVRIAVRATGARLTLQVADNGSGFNVRETAAAAARRGRLGIVGMHERVRLLGGVLSIASAPGAGTTISASIPAWRPLA